MELTAATKPFGDKLSLVLIQRYSDRLNPIGFCNFLINAIKDVESGIDGYTGGNVERDPDLKIDNFVIIEFARVMRGDEFAKRVEFYLPLLRR